ncbi:5-oxoprolinase subunit PxpB [Paenibacillus cellulositrophicus]|uniref:5-oxoprolinase subunit PxpB n=1 Tax=Paenibacillus cellulositrophicus TaxID=562959 RepID=UPI00203F0595|nr:5-oxoprolinase subunit PxpB [Paenibacillus cellulositrophicus]MCM2997809.1 5-oxoprolinase subunit PxpB [Paenibacillus cellulositrophicus]
MNRNEARRVVPLGESAVVVHLGGTVSEDLHREVQALTRRIEANPFPGFVECVPAFTSVTVLYDPFELDLPLHETGRMDYVQSLLETCMADIQGTPDAEPVVIDIPVCYGGGFGPDLEEVASINNLTTQDVVRIHTAQTYLVYAVGFAPGFPYLGGLDERIAAPRKPSPRLAIPAGSVGIAGTQTGIYPVETPGGWQIIGRTPLPLFRPDQDPPALLRGGEYIRFRQIDAAEYERIKGAQS